MCKSLYYIISDIAKSFKDYQGFWSFIQGFAAPLAIWASFIIPNRFRKNEELDNLLSARNICHVSARFTIFLSNKIINDPLHDRKITEVKYCQASLQTINLNQIRPANLIADAIHIQGITIKFIQELEKPTPAPDELAWIRDEAKKAMGNLDRELVRRGVKFTPEPDRMAYR